MITREKENLFQINEHINQVDIYVTIDTYLYTNSKTNTIFFKKLRYTQGNTHTPKSLFEENIYMDR